MLKYYCQLKLGVFSNFVAFSEYLDNKESLWGLSNQSFFLNLIHIFLILFQEPNYQSDQATSKKIILDKFSLIRTVGGIKNSNIKIDIILISFKTTPTLNCFLINGWLNLGRYVQVIFNIEFIKMNEIEKPSEIHRFSHI